MTTETPCSTGRCGYDEPCRCSFYANWITVPPACTPKLIRSGGYKTGYGDGHKRGYAQGYHDAIQEKTVV